VDWGTSVTSTGWKLIIGTVLFVAGAMIHAFGWRWAARIQTTLLAIVMLGLVVAGGIAIYRWHEAGAPEPAPSVATAPPPAAAPAPEAPAIAHPLPEPAPGGPPLPALAESDTAAHDALARLFGSEAVARYFNTEGAIRRFVATVDNLPRKSAAARLMPVKPVPGPFAVEGGGAEATIGPQNALRYRPYIVAMEAADAKRLVATYVQLYPLFQSAYQELGYPNGYFNDRLVEAIDDMLATPDVGSPRLAQPKVLYEFADPELESLSAGQKILVRMGPENAKRVKDKLRAIRRELTVQRLS
jgi:hypothetical protein